MIFNFFNGHDFIAVLTLDEYFVDDFIYDSGGWADDSIDVHFASIGALLFHFEPMVDACFAEEVVALGAFHGALEQI